MISIVLVEPAVPGNIGAVARAMKNFGFDRLLLINPKCDPQDEEAIYRAKHAQDILANAEIVTWKDVRKHDCVIGTTALTGSTYNIPRTPLTPGQLAIPPKSRIALVFGREGDGLHNEEVMDCDIICTIPTKKAYRALNLSHAVAIVLYELSKDGPSITSHVTYASEKEKQIIMDSLEQVLKILPFQSERMRETQRKAWRRIIGKSFLTKREAFALMGFLKKIK